MRHGQSVVSVNPRPFHTKSNLEKFPHSPLQEGAALSNYCGDCGNHYPSIVIPKPAGSTAGHH
jgi:hypothetical protein